VSGTTSGGRRRRKAQLAFIPDEPQLFDYLTVEEHPVYRPLYGVDDASAPFPLLREMELTEAIRLAAGTRGNAPEARDRLWSPAPSSALILDSRDRPRPAGSADASDHCRQGAGRHRGGSQLAPAALVEALCTTLLVSTAGHRVRHAARSWRRDRAGWSQPRGSSLR
jgi:ABC-2 type transport system ATP-binding protein